MFPGMLPASSDNATSGLLNHSQVNGLMLDSSWGPLSGGKAVSYGRIKLRGNCTKKLTALPFAPGGSTPAWYCCCCPEP